MSKNGGIIGYEITAVGPVLVTVVRDGTLLDPSRLEFLDGHAEASAAHKAKGSRSTRPWS